MKKFNKRLLVLTMALVALLAVFCGCGGNELKGEATVIIHGSTDAVYTVNLSETNFTTQNTVLDLLGYLCDKKDLEFNATASGSAQFGYSAFVNSIGALNPSGAEYIAFYHNKQADKDVSAYAQPDIQKDGTTYYYSGLGVGSVKLVDGIKIYFTILTY